MSLLKRALDYEHFLVMALIPLFWIALLASVQGDGAYWLQYWWMFPIAFLIALTVNTVGISGAALFVPFFVIIFPLLATPLLPEQSVKLGLITESFGLTSSALAFLRYGLIDWRIGLYAVIGATPFVIGGAMIAFAIPKQAFHAVIALVLLVSVYLLLNKKRHVSKMHCITRRTIDNRMQGHTDSAVLVARDGKRYRYCRRGYLRRFVGYGLGGVSQGLAGFGIGELGIVSMLMTRIPLRVAIGTSHLIVSLTAIVASLTHVSQSLAHNIATPWSILFMTVPAVILGGQAAPYVAARLRSELLERVIAGLFVVLAGALLFMGFIQ